MRVTAILLDFSYNHERILYRNITYFSQHRTKQAHHNTLKKSSVISSVIRESVCHDYLLLLK